MIFINRPLRTASYLLSSVGLSLILLSGPLPVILLAKGISDHYRVFLKSILQNWGFEVKVLPLWLTPFSYIIMTVILALVGFLLWFPPWSFLHRIQATGGQRTPDITQRLYCYWTIFLAVIAILGDLLFLGLVSLIVILGFGFGEIRGPREMQLFLLSVLLLAGFLLGHIRTALLISRYYRRLLRD